MSDIYELITVIFIAVLPSIVGCCQLLRTSKSLSKSSTELKRQNKGGVVAGNYWSLYWSISAILVATAFALTHDGGLLSIGLDIDRIDLFWGGFIFCGALAAVITISQFLLGITGRKQKKDVFQRQQLIFLSKMPITMRVTWVLAVVIISISEEILYRGYFILYWADKSDHFFWWVLLISVFFVMLHLYQGIRLIPTHVFLVSLLTLPALATGSIMISMGIHVCWNLYFVIYQLVAARKINKVPSGQYFEHGEGI